MLDNIKRTVIDSAKDRLGRTVLTPLNTIIDDQITDIASSIGMFIIRSIRGKFQRSISFSVGENYKDHWKEQALYAILSKYNDLRTGARLRLSNIEIRDEIETDPSSYLDEGVHPLKYRDYNILLSISHEKQMRGNSRIATVRNYTVIVYNLDPKFVVQFERDMIFYRNKNMKLGKDSPYVRVFKEYANDWDTGWLFQKPILKRRIDSVYLPMELKRKIVDTINNFFLSREEYKKWGIPHKLNILLTGVGGVGKDTIVRMIASEWNRNIYYLTGGANGKTIPEVLTANDAVVQDPLFVISDIDKYSALINDTEIDLDKESGSKETQMRNKQMFGNMINALDGILTSEGRIVIMTTNHIEKFSPIFLREGRIDLQLEIPTVGVEVMRRFVYDYYQQLLPENVKLKEKDLRMASLQFDAIISKMPFDEFRAKYIK